MTKEAGTRLHVVGLGQGAELVALRGVLCLASMVAVQVPRHYSSCVVT